MSNTVISVENLSKYYRLGTIGTGTLRDDVDRLVARLRGKEDPLGKISEHRAQITDSARGNGNGAHREIENRKSKIENRKSDYLWALRDVSFEVKQGEVVGIIGRNGAGKSTLLKILSRITAPTSGVVKVKGRIASLLEVGTGFHPELTGRENIFLNGAILGMKRQEIERKFEEIVSFAEVEKFIDTPVKRYSSGMYVRLAFAVAAHLEPEILLVDEVLAVGDAAFQKKCLGKMGDVAREGRTVLFVSHNMAAITNLCLRALWVDSGAIQNSGGTDSVVAAYLQSTQAHAGVGLDQRNDRTGNGVMRFSRIALKNYAGKFLSALPANQEAVFELEYTSEEKELLRNVRCDMTIRDMHGQRLFTLSSYFVGNDFDLLPPNGLLVCNVPMLTLAPSHYTVDLWSSVNGTTSDALENVLEFEITETDFYGSGRVPIVRKHGTFMIPHEWSAGRTDSVCE